MKILFIKLLAEYRKTVRPVTKWAQDTLCDLGVGTIRQSGANFVTGVALTLPDDVDLVRH
jgi:hypothetical protein